jgi:peptide chain release factor 2
VATDPSEELKNLRTTMDSIEAVLDVDKLRGQIADLEEQASAPDLWDDQAKAQAVTSKLSGLQAELNRFTTLNRRL